MQPRYFTRQKVNKYQTYKYVCSKRNNFSMGQGLRRVWRLQKTTKGDMLAAGLYLCMMNYVVSLFISSFRVWIVVLSWLDSLFGLAFKKHCKKSPLGRNARFCAIRFGFLPFDIGQYKLIRTCSFASKFASSLTAGFMDWASFAYEVIAIREGHFTTMHYDFSR